jgi:hypothetical protein
MSEDSEFLGSSHVFFMETAMIGLVVKITLKVEANSIPSQWLVGIEEFKILAYPREDIRHIVSRTRIVTLSNSRPHDVFHFSSLPSGIGFPLRIHREPAWSLAVCTHVDCDSEGQSGVAAPSVSSCMAQESRLIPFNDEPWTPRSESSCTFALLCGLAPNHRDLKRLNQIGLTDLTELRYMRYLIFISSSTILLKHTRNRSGKGHQDVESKGYWYAERAIRMLNRCVRPMEDPTHKRAHRKIGHLVWDFTCLGFRV